ncbi:type II toxin-antitoxin system RelE family toxin [Anoxynatronum buryatiense]|uniref:mRNA interferase RelE/StbE n=1 Tax=Anoxynatronum buryatiense TaxID=489973 RepID=A0AA46AJV8_9CLOT|nr:type II toxin-antitoxin system RelE/ParE family toxin [Anoxynatronum buryatiense]SMP65162.1 mRNA interferase RelE/StbE [Anoxynatronum buryatiense]
MYLVKFTENAKKELQKLDKHTSKLLLAWIRKNLEGTDNPWQHGKGLTANKRGQWRYRVGEYRLLVEIKDTELIILVLAVGHRKNVYL